MLGLYPKRRIMRGVAELNHWSQINNIWLRAIISGERDEEDWVKYKGQCKITQLNKHGSQLD